MAENSKKIDEIQTGFARLFGGDGGSFLAIVKAKAEGNLIDVSDLNDTLYPDVRLNASLDNDGIIIHPAINSFVIVSRLSKTDSLYVSMFSKIESIVIKIDGTELVIDSAGCKFGKGEHTTAFADVLKEQLNKLSKRVDDIISALNSATPDSSAGTFSASLKLLLAKIIDKESFSGIENDKIKHS